MRIRTGYSFGSAVGHLPDALARVKAIGAPGAPITDTASTYGWVKWNKLCTKAGLKPVFGVELAVSKSIVDKSADYWTFLAIDSVAPVNQLVKLATENFYYMPRLSIDQALKATGVGIIVGKLTDPNDIPPEQMQRLRWELSPGISKGQFSRVTAAQGVWVATPDNRYAGPDDWPLYATIIGSRPGRSASRSTYPQHIVNDFEWDRSLRWVEPDVKQEAIRERNWLLEQCNATLKPGVLFPYKPDKTLREMCEEGAVKLGCDLTRPEYAARLDKELGLIASKNFETYFYIIADICQYARQHMIVGPARGSSCGSLVCYLLSITTVDPIPYKLIFERFIDVNRDDLPDVDIDFADHKREMVFTYMMRKFGIGHVARLGTVSTFKPRSALQEVAKSLSIPMGYVFPVLDSIIVRSGGDSRAMQATEDTLNETEAGKLLLKQHPEIRLAMKLEGHPKHSSQHAAGMVLTAQPISETVAFDVRTGSIQCDKKDAEDLNLLKIDALGLTQLSVFERCLELIGVPKDDRWSYLDHIPLDDQAAFDVLNKKHYAGIFQFNGAALQSITSQVKVNHFEDIVSITALGRPGPLATGGTNHWVKVKNGLLPVTYPHPLFQSHLEATLGIITYQEQVMTIGREIGDLSWGDVTALRKAMSKSLGKEYFDQFGDKWKAAAEAKGVPHDIAYRVWDDLCAYGSWSFNRSHAVAYGLVSYYCCWLKAHHPLEFAAASLSFTDSEDTQRKLLREMADEGVSYVPVDQELSEAQWTVKRGKLIGPLTAMIGLGPRLLDEVLVARYDNKPLPSRVVKLFRDGARTKIDTLYPIRDYFQQLDLGELNVTSPLSNIKDINTNGVVHEVACFACVKFIKPRSENEEVNVARRGGEIYKEFTRSLNMTIEDDTDRIFAKVDRFNFDTMGNEIIERGKAGKALYFFKGTVPPGFRMIRVSRIKYIGDLDTSLGDIGGGVGNKLKAGEQDED